MTTIHFDIPHAEESRTISLQHAFYNEKIYKAILVGQAKGEFNVTIVNPETTPTEITHLRHKGYLVEYIKGGNHVGGAIGLPIGVNGVNDVPDTLSISW
jgi:hypothetical protein